MNAFKDVTVTDLHGAAAQFESYIKNDLGFDARITVEVGIANGRGQVWLRAHDAFQVHGHYENEIGDLSLLENIDLDHDWAAACNLVWTRLKKAMPRDEREMRHGLAAMSGIIENAPSYQSAVGKMLADRVLKLRDDVNNNLLEYRRPAAE